MKDRIYQAFDRQTLSEEGEERIRSAIQQGEKAWNTPLKPRRAVLSLVLAVILATVAAAVVYARIQLDIRSVYVEEGETVYTVSFKPMDTEPIELGDWYPAALGEEYELYHVSSDENGMQVLVFYHGQEAVVFAYAKASDQCSFALRHVDKVQWCSVGEVKGCLFTRNAGSYDDQVVQVKKPETLITTTPRSMGDQLLFWTDEERGLGFVLKHIGEDEMDLPMLAESVMLLEEPLERYDEIHAAAALVKLGDYQFETIPSGYRMEDSYGEPCNPLMSPDWYGYVHRVYRNGENRVLDLYYEFIPNREESRYISFYEEKRDLGDGKYLLLSQEQRVLGIQWEQKDENGTQLTFTVMADALDEETLLELAENVVCVSEANTDRFIRP